MRRVNLKNLIKRGSICRYSWFRTKPVNLRMDIIIIDSNQSFNKIFFRKILTAGVYTDKNLGNIFFIRFWTDFQGWQRINSKIQKVIDVFFNDIFFLFRKQLFPVFLPAFIYRSDKRLSESWNSVLLVRRKHTANLADPFWIAFIRLCPDGKFAR